MRSIFRNVQYIFLFLSVLLVFLALQKLQYLPQHHNSFAAIGAITPAADFNTDYELQSSFYYRGDEMTEIGWRSFRVGVFKFILPSFSSSSSSPPSRTRSENTEYYLTVPPPNDRPKSVAYILDLSTRQSAIDINTIAKARALAKSIQRMHSDSKYGYKLFTIINSEATIINSEARLSPPLPASDESDDGMTKKLTKLGFDIIDSTVYREEVNAIDSIRDETMKRTGSKHTMYKIWKRHDVIISLPGIELHPSWNLDGLFDIFLSKNNLRFPGVDSFLLQPYQSYTTGREEILIFNGSSHQAFETCLEFLSCVTADVPLLDEMDKETEESTEANISRRCIAQIDSNRGLAMCTYHQDFIDCSESMMKKKDIT